MRIGRAAAYGLSLALAALGTAAGGAAGASGAAGTGGPRVTLVSGAAAAGGPQVTLASGAATAAVAGGSGGAGGGGPRVKLSASFQPARLGASTTLHWGFTISEPTALRSLELRLPPGMGFATSSLGLEACPPARLAEAGPAGCPADSRMGFGSALAEVPAQSTVRESAGVTALLGPPEGENMTVLFFVEGKWPVNREIVLTSHLLHIAGPDGAALLTEIPPLQVWPAGPAIDFLRFQSTLGPAGLTYYRHAHGKTIAFTPRGLSLPKRCPRGGFPVAATFTWWPLDTKATASTRVPCPARATARSSGLLY